MSICVIRAWDSDGNQHILDVKGKQSFPTNFELADVMDLKSSKSGFNKSIDLPATERNVAYFGAYWDVNELSSFDPKEKKRAILEYDTVKVLDGWIQLVEVKVENGRAAEYNVRIFSEESTLFKDTSKKLLRDLEGLSRFDHDLTLTDVADGFEGLSLEGDTVLSDDFSGSITTGGSIGDNGTYAVVGSTFVASGGEGDYTKTASTSSLRHFFTCTPGTRYKYKFDCISTDSAFSVLIQDDVSGTISSSTMAVGSVSLEWTASNTNHQMITGTGASISDTFTIDNIELVEMDDDGVYYGLQDYGDELKAEDGDVAGNIYATTDANRHLFLKCKPYLKLKPIVDLIMNEAGYTYESSFLDSDYFNDIYLLAHSEGDSINIKSDEVHLFKAGVTSDVTLATTANDYTEISFDDESSFDFQDSNQVHDADTGFGGTPTGSSGSAFLASYDSFSAGFYKLRTSLRFTPGAAAAVYQVSLWRRVPGGSDVQDSTSFAVNVGTVTDELFEQDFNVYLNAYYYIRIRTIGTGSTSVIEAGEDTFFECYESPLIPVEDLPENAILSFETSENVPQETTQSEVLEFLDNRFNCLFVRDRVKPNHFIIEPYTDYVTGGTEKDWSHKLDISKTYTVKPMSSVEKKDIEFTTKEGDDILNKLVKDNSGRIYGRQRFINDVNDFATGKKEIKSPDVVSPLNALSGSDIMIPRLYTDDLSPVRGDLRFFVKGDSVYDATHGDGAKFKLRDWNDAVSADIDNYTHFGHYKEPIPENDDTDLNYGKETPFHSLINQPTQTAYERYWRTYLDQIYGDDARMLVAFFNLDLFDIEDFNWSDQIYVLNAWWIVNKIDGFDPLGSKSTKVELIKFSNSLSGMKSLEAGTKSTQAKSNTLRGIDGEDKTVETDLFKGFIDYNDTTGVVSLSAETWTDVPNNGLGAFTNKSFKPKGVGELIDTSTGYLDFTDLTLGSQIKTRNDFTINPTTNNSLLEVRYVLGQGANEYVLKFWSERLDQGSGIDYQRVIPFPIYMGDVNTQGGVGKLQVKLSTPGTLVNSGTYIDINLR